MKTFTLDYGDAGEICLNGISSEIYTRGHWSLFQRKLERMLGKAVKGAVYLWYKRGTKEALEIYSIKNAETLRTLDKRVMAEQLLEQIYKFGYGDPRIISFTPDRELVVEVRNSFNAVGYNKTKHCVCYALCGIIAGGAEMLFGKPMECEEIKCRARGDGNCQFRVLPASEHKKIYCEQL